MTVRALTPMARTVAADGAGPMQGPGQAHPNARTPKRRPVIKQPKAASAEDCAVLEQLPNVGPAIAADLRLIGVQHPRELRDRDAFALYQALCAATGRRQDPCVLDTFMAATDFMHGAPPAPWWHYTARRKLQYGQVDGVVSQGAGISSSTAATSPPPHSGR